MTGTITRIISAKGFGFIKPDGGGNQRDIFFHVNDLPDELAFDEQLIERAVGFDIIDTDKGKRAHNVRSI